MVLDGGWRQAMLLRRGPRLSRRPVFLPARGPPAPPESTGPEHGIRPNAHLLMRSGTANETAENGSVSAATAMPGTVAMGTALTNVSIFCGSFSTERLPW